MSPDLTDYHAKYIAHELTRRHPPDSAEKLAGAVASAQVDLNPHQVDAALFAFASPLSTEALLADEAGLGKTMEAGLVTSQRWAEHKHRILVITPSNVRKQWFQELTEKFFLPCRILEARSYKAAIKEAPAPVSRRRRHAGHQRAQAHTRPGADRDAAVYTEEQLEQLEQLKLEGKPLVKPFVLVVTQDIVHASEIEARIKADSFFGGQYRDKVITVHSTLRGEEKEENVERLLKVEDRDEPTEIHPPTAGPWSSSPSGGGSGCRTANAPASRPWTG